MRENSTSPAEAVTMSRQIVSGRRPSRRTASACQQGTDARLHCSVSQPAWTARVFVRSFGSDLETKVDAVLVRRLPL